jgi:hydroxymethylglutaryl-CoA synthase
MLGILSFGAYIPFFRLNRSEIANAWERSSFGGEKSLSNNDEDTATMAIEAAFDCLKGMARENIDGLFFASTTPPYSEKQAASLVASVLSLNDNAFTVDFANSLRSGTNAMKAAYHMSKSSEFKNILVTASDSRLGYPRSDFEQTFGDGAAAILFGKGNAIATLEGFYSIFNDMMDLWRNPNDMFVRTWERRWVLEEGYMTIMKKAVQGLLDRYGLKSKDIQKVVLPAPNVKSHQKLLKSIGFTPSQIQDPLLSAVGDCGTAHPLMMFVGAMEEAKPGDQILLASYGDGADAFLFKVTDELLNLSKRRGVKGHISSKASISTYQRYLSFRGLLETVPGEPFRLLPSATATWRDRESATRCYGSKCRQCGSISYPIQRICNECQSKDDYEKVNFSDQKGFVFTFSRDVLAGRSDDPEVVQTVVEFGQESARFYCMMTDCIPSEVKIGMPVELTFRKIYEGAGFRNYFWKCRPIRNGE